MEGKRGYDGLMDITLYMTIIDEENKEKSSKSLVGSSEANIIQSSPQDQILSESQNKPSLPLEETSSELQSLTYQKGA